MMWNVHAKPFTTNFDKQVDIIQNLYDNSFSFVPDKEKIYEACGKIEKIYGWKIANQIKTIFNKQVYLNMVFNTNKITNKTIKSTIR